MFSHGRGTPVGFRVSRLGREVGDPPRGGAARWERWSGRWGLRCRVDGVGFRVSGFGVRAWGFGSRVSGFGFRVPGFGFRGSSCGFRFRAAEPCSGYRENDQLRWGLSVRCRANSAHIRQKEPESGSGFQVKVLKTSLLFPLALGKGMS